MKFRRYLALVLALAMLLSMAAPALALAEDNPLDLGGELEVTAEGGDIQDVVDAGEIDLSGGAGEAAAETFTVTFMVGDAVYATQTVAKDGYPVQPETAPEAEGGVFAYWHLETEEASDYFASPVAIGSDTVLIAAFTEAEAPADEQPEQPAEEQPEETPAEEQPEETPEQPAETPEQPTEAPAEEEQTEEEQTEVGISEEPQTGDDVAVVETEGEAEAEPAQPAEDEQPATDLSVEEETADAEQTMETVDTPEMTGYSDGTVAVIGTTEYSSLRTALEAGGDVLLVSNVDYTEEKAVITKTVTLTAAQEYTITTNLIDRFTVNTGGKLTIGENVVINASKGAVFDVEGGEVVIDGCTIYGGSGNATAYVASGSLTVSSGTLKSNTLALSVIGSGTATIEGGLIDSETGTTIRAGSGAYADTNGVITITGGEIKTDSSDYCTAWARNGGKIIVDGGTVTSGGNAALVATAKSSVEVKSGIVGATTGYAVLAHEGNASATINGGTINGYVGAGSSNNGAGNTVTITGGTINGEIIAQAGNGTVEAKFNNSEAKLQYPVSSDMVQDGYICTSRRLEDGYYHIVKAIKITFDPDGGTFEDTQLVLDENGKYVVTIPQGENFSDHIASVPSIQFSKTDATGKTYYFQDESGWDGYWYYKGNDGNPVQYYEWNTADASVTYKPTWKEALTITFDPDGGEFEDAQLVLKDGKYVVTMPFGKQYSEYFQNAPAIKSTKKDAEGNVYYFKGEYGRDGYWYYEDGNGGKPEFNSGNPAYESVTYKPSWNKAVTFTFEADGGKFTKPNEPDTEVLKFYKPQGVTFYNEDEGRYFPEIEEIKNDDGKLFKWSGVWQYTNPDQGYTYTIDPKEDWAKQTSISDEDLTFTPVWNEVIAEVTDGVNPKYVASLYEINGIDAFKDEKSLTITMLADADDVETTFYNKNISIDLNGFTISSYDDDYTAIDVYDGDLTIYNSNADKKGTINGWVNAYSDDPAKITVSGKLDLKVKLGNPEQVVTIDSLDATSSIQLKLDYEPDEESLVVVTKDLNGSENLFKCFTAKGYDMFIGTNDNLPEEYRQTGLGEIILKIKQTDWWKLQQLIYNAKDGDTLKLAQDYAYTEDDVIGDLEIDGKKLTIDLNGHTLDRKYGAFEGDEYWKGPVISSYNSDLTIKGSGKITGGTYGVRAYGYSDEENPKKYAFTLEGGTITGNNYGVMLDGKALEAKMTGGSITGNEGMGVYVDYESTFTMTGGSITGNEGRGVYVDDESTFTMTGGSITGNEGTGVYVGYESTFTMTGGSITENERTGVVVSGKSTFTMTGGEITKNTVEGGNGAGVYVDNGSTFTMSGGSITGNKAVKSEYDTMGYSGQGGGVYVNYNATFNVSGNPTITGNTAEDGANVYLRGEYVDPWGGYNPETHEPIEVTYPAALITVTGALSGAKIGVTTEAKPSEQDGVVTFTKDYAKYNAGKDPADVFTSDDAKYVAGWNDAETEGVLGLEIKATATGYTGVYDGKAHAGATVTVTAPKSGATVTYSKDGKTYAKDAPTYTDAGEYTVYYKVAAKGYAMKKGAVTARITKAESKETVTAEGWTYGEAAKTPVVSGYNGDGKITFLYAKAASANGEYAANAGETYSETVPSDAGDYLVKASIAATANYAAVESDPASFTIAKAKLTIVADAKSKTEGEADPELTYTAKGLVGSDKLTGALTRAAGEAVGVYPITIGTLTAGDNYEIAFTGSNLTITAKAQPEPQPAKSKGIFLVTAKASGGKCLKVTWTALKDARVDGYDVFMADCGQDDHGPFKLVRSVTAATRSVKLSGLKKQTAYKVMIKAFDIQDGKKVYIGESAQVAHAYTDGGSKSHTNPKSISLNKTKVSLKVGEKFNIKATVKGLKSGKKVLAHGGLVRYVSSDKSVATVSATGRITAVGAGKCKVYAVTANGIYKAVSVTVKGSGTPTGIAFKGSAYSVKKGKTLKLGSQVKLTPSDAKTSLAWKSSDKKIATVDKNGKVKGLKKGVVTITVKTANGLTASVKVKVN